jgi:hypothetical protein
MLKVGAQCGAVAPARRVDRLVGRHRQAGDPHPEERLGPRFIRADAQRSTPGRLNLGDDLVRSFPDLGGELARRRQAVLAHG